jgi:ketosteroid isomerase-like protein
MMMPRPPVDVVLDVLDAVERRDAPRLAELYHPDIEFHWPPSLPYSGVHRGAAVSGMSLRFAQVWLPLQPTENERRMDPLVVAAQGSEVVVRYSWKGRDAAGTVFETPTMAHYQVQDQKLVRAQMYHYDLVGLANFVRAART